MRMRPAAALLLLLVACAERWERPGATEAESEAALAICTGEAARQVPPAMAWTMVAPGSWIPGEQRCWTQNNRTECVRSPPRFIPPRYDWVDLAAGQRRAVRNACMAEGGWTYEGLRPLRLQ